MIAVRLLLQSTASSTVKAVINIYRRGEVDVLLNNETNSWSENKSVASFKNILAFTVDKAVIVLVGSGLKGNEDGTALLFNRTESARARQQGTWS